jgi:hypothetical protein
MGGNPAFADEIDVAQVNEQAQPLSQHKNQVLLMNGINEKDYSSAEAEIPENFRHDALLDALRRNPLHDEAHHEQKLSEKADNRPQSPMSGKPGEDIFHLYDSFVRYPHLSPEPELVSSVSAHFAYNP